MNHDNTCTPPAIDDFFQVSPSQCTQSPLPTQNFLRSRSGSASSGPPLWSVIFNHGFLSPSNPLLNSITSNIDSVRHNVGKYTNIPNRNGSIPVFIAGTLAFYCSAFTSTFVQWKYLKISTGTRPFIVPATLGAMTVAFGSLMGNFAGVGTAAALNAVEYFRVNERKESPQNLKIIHAAPVVGGSAARSVQEMVRPMMIIGSDVTRQERSERNEAWMHVARICILGLVVYKTIFRSHFCSISPSSYTARGSFARGSIPAPPNFNYATRAQRDMLERIGSWWGCHTCGSRMLFSNIAKNVPKFHGDHIPPVSVAKQLNSRWYRKNFGWKVPQKFYPQCRDCSNKQGGLLSKAIQAGNKNLHAVGGGEESYFHGRRLRIGHLTGGLVALLSVRNDFFYGSEAEIVDASRERVHLMQTMVFEFGIGVLERLQKCWDGDQ